MSEPKKVVDIFRPAYRCKCGKVYYTPGFHIGGPDVCEICGRLGSILIKGAVKTTRLISTGFLGFGKSDKIIDRVWVCYLENGDIDERQHYKTFTRQHEG